MMVYDEIFIKTMSVEATEFYRLILAVQLH